MSLPHQFNSEIDQLTREALSAHPADVIQFCANYFNKRLESERSATLQQKPKAKSSSSSRRATGNSNGNNNNGNGNGNASLHMADNSFPGTNPFTAGSGMQRLEEEDENDPTSTSNFPRSSTMEVKPPPPSSSATFGNFGDFGSWGTSASSGQTGSSPPSADQGAQSLPSNYNTNRRTSVSAESLNPATSVGDKWQPPYHKKTDEQQQRLKKAVSGNFLFSHLDDEQSEQVLGALQEKPIPAKGIKVIQQGDVGDYFYIVESGSLDIYVNKSGKLEAGPDGIGDNVASCGPGNSFGELALMYNAPRAATVVSTEQSMLWALDRVTFRRILMDSAFQRRRMYENFLEEVPLLISLKPYERSKISDALETQKYPAGSTIIKEGDPGEAFYILESGEAEVYKDGVDKPVKKYTKGDYFGELALLNDAPRAASVVARTEVKVATLGKAGFQRLLGPVESIMRRNDPSKQKMDDSVDPLSR